MEQNITVKTSTWFLTTVAYEKTMENGMEKRVKETYVVNAFSFTDAEKSIFNNMGHNDIEVTDITKAPFGEIFFTDNEKADKFYKVKANFITLDENTGKEKKSLVYYLVQATSTKDAQHNFDDVMGRSMTDYSIEAIIETKVLDVFIA